jgi:3-keto-5-aminohexanoate cleavage enzyme
MYRDAVIVEVGLNEAVTRTQHAAVPYSPSECADDARRCADAGAAVIHWHAREPVTGAPRFGDAALYGEALDLMRTSRTDVLAYPTYPIDGAPGGRLAHCWRLARDHGLKIAPIDVGSVSVVLWDEVGHDFVGVNALRERGVVDNPLPFVLDAVEQVNELGMLASLGCFDVGFTRLVALLAESGRLREPLFVKFFLSGAWTVGPAPCEAAIDVHLDQLPAGLDVEWAVVPYTLRDPALVERIARHALARGGGVRVGIGDNPAAFPTATNAQLVELAAGWAADAGRPLASASDVRERFGLTERA